MREGSLYAIIYAVIWVVVFVKLLRHTKENMLSIVVVAFYVLYSVLAIFLYNDPYNQYVFNNVTLFPYLYLFGMIYLSLIPILRYDQSHVVELVRPNPLVLNCFIYAFIFLSVILIPPAILELRTGLFILLTDPSGGLSLYEDAHGGGVIQRTIWDVPKFVFIMFSYISVLIFFYYLTLPRLKRFVLIGLFLSMLYNIISPISMGLRTGAVMTMLSILAAYIMMHKWIPKNRCKYINIIGLSIGGAIVALLLVLSISRFEDKAAGTGGTNLYYIAQSSLNFNNYGLDAGGIRYGDRTCRIFKEILGFDNVPSGVTERRAMYHNMKMDDRVFYTFVGDFTLDFGPVVALLMFLLYSFSFKRITRVRNHRISFSKLLLLYLAVLIPLQGGMYLFSFSDGGNYSLIAFAFTAVAFNLFDKKRGGNILTTV